ncbi:ATP-dependent DNA ligase LigD phosphoesterase module /ATP-dependent DNA ligase LigD polymerase module [Luteibacter rhizovicinus]|uniref:DNA ligase (ATP) n=1 Tax=Luteibacter rhizovicinus TaxID=242606 RepID=A0A4R3YX62_9GAMM|nr:DNA ligase D [Luteibacter rhizovicinus]TCV97767.1 ATP-dependent DNA ligase LigD phosphoesterase module /ATP-dependent DNA ligase LigD polymerase module [Luteibacter rhizovicinus]
MGNLRDYQRKRDFSRTLEPATNEIGTTDRRAIFVVQLHHASRRHFDFRLQIGDVLKSWAVPKGPSFDPQVKRLAVEVEDHPLAYADFEGDIEHGYGKGHVDQFDQGVWTTPGDAEAQLQKGHLRFELFGKRLKGGWHLVRSGRKERQPAWFLIKAKDAFAGDVEADDLLNAKMTRSTRTAAKTPATRAAAKKSTARKKSVPRTKKLPRVRLAKAAAALTGARPAMPSNDFFKPELARLRASPPEGAQWLHEVKWDGYRILAAIADGEVKLWSRNALPWNDRLPDIVQSVESLGLHAARFDGELIALDGRGHSDFNGLQQTLSGEAQLPLVYMLFDLPSLEGSDLSRVGLLERKQLLEKLLAHGPKHLAFSTHVIGDGQEVFRMASDKELEGILSKRIDSPYRPGRGDDWLKIKRRDSDEFAVVGYTPPKGSRSGFGSLLLAKPDPQRRSGWIYVGRVGTGFSNAQLQKLSRSIADKGRAKPTVELAAIDPLLRDAQWVKPVAVAEVYYRGIGNKNLLRQPSLKIMRTDKTPADLVDSDRASSKPAKRKAGAERRKSVESKPIDIKITHPDRVVYPDDSYTKQDVVDYYTSIMKWFLPGVVDRPTSVIRCPEGTAKACFFQKHLIPGLKQVGSVTMKEESGARATYIYSRDAGSVIELVQFGVLEFHPWGSTIEQPDLANQLVFDLDPGDDVAWPRVVAAARLMHKLLAQLGLASFLRTTGGKGLHVVVPLNPGCAWAQVKDFAHAFAATVVQAHPLEFIATATKAQRSGKIYIDYLRNSRGATSVASYSLRARSGAPVAVPLRWSELGKLKSGHDFDIRSTPRRLARLRSDPWAGIDDVRQDLGAIIGKLR